MITTSRTASRQGQRGVVAVMAAVMMTTLIMFLAVVVDTGRIFLEKRSLQKNADLAALETALLYCRDQTMTDADRRSVALDALSADRNDFKGNFGDDDEDGDIKVSLGRVQGGGAGGRVFTPNSAGENGKAVEVKLTRTIPASLFQQLWPSSPGDIDLYADAVAQACEPTARLELRTNLAGFNSRASVLNGLFNGVLGTDLDLDAVSWQGIADTNINLLDFLDVAIDLRMLPVDAGDYNGALGETISIGELAKIASDNRLLGNSLGAVGELLSGISGASNEITLGQLLDIASDTTDAALDVSINLFDLINGSVQVAAHNSGATIDLPIAPLGVTTKIQIAQPPQLSPTGNPETDEIFVKSAQVKVFLSFDLSAGIFGPLTDLDNALTSSQLINGVVNVVEQVLLLDIAGALDSVLGGLFDGIFGGSSDPETVIEPQLISSPRIDIAILAGQGMARVTGYECDGGYKSLEAEGSTGLTEIKVGSFGETSEDANNAFTNYEFENITVSPIKILDIGTYEVRSRCGGLLNPGCDLEYRTSSGGWSDDFADADRREFAAGGITLRMDADGASLLGNTETLPRYENIPDETELPNVDQEISEEVFSNPEYTVSGGNLVSGLSDTLSSLQIEFHEPDGSGGLGGALSLVGTALEPILNDIVPTLLNTLAPIIDPIIDNIINALGVELAGASIGAAMTCENDKVRLVM